MVKPIYARHDKFIGRGLSTFDFGIRLKKEIDKRVKKNRKLSILEIGSGKGNLLIDLAFLYPHIKLTGVNKNSTHGIKNLQELNKRAKERGLKFKPGQMTVKFANATSLPFSDSTFDVITSQVTFLHVENKAKALEEVYRVLKPGGVAIISLGAYSINRKRGHKMPLFYRSLNKKLGRDFNPRFIIRSEGKYVPISSFFKNFHNNQIEFWTENFVSESQRGILHRVILHKQTAKLDLGLKYLSEESKKLTNLYRSKNPVNWGVIDMYTMK
jgi:ubiquinone/menaquinone biosynthesis C-methylase UbiE